MRLLTSTYVPPAFRDYHVNRVFVIVYVICKIHELCAVFMPAGNAEASPAFGS